MNGMIIQRRSPYTPSGTRCFVARRPTEPDTVFLHLKDMDGFFLCETVYPNGKANMQTVSVLSNLWRGVLPRLAMHCAKPHVICYEPASSCLLQVVSPRLVSGGGHMLLPCSTPLVISPAFVKVCVVFLAPNPTYPLVILVILSFWLSFFHKPFPALLSFSRWAEGQNSTEYLG